MQKICVQASKSLFIFTAQPKTLMGNRQKVETEGHINFQKLRIHLKIPGTSSVTCVSSTNIRGSTSISLHYNNIW